MFKKNKEIYEDDEIIIDKINYIDNNEEKEKRAKKLINIFFYAAIIIILLISIDIVCITKFNVGPFFAIRTNVYNDGGTKVYYGIGYKVIKYHQKQGRRDTVIGMWSMPYSTTPTDIKLVDLAIELENNPEKNYQKFSNKFLRVSGQVSKVNKKANTITLKYYDEDGKYTLNLICQLSKDSKKVSTKKINSNINIIGTVSKYELKNKSNPNTLYMKDCFTE